MIAFLCGLIVGFLMCVPVGPINVWVINAFLKKGERNALSIALGGSVMDIIYFLIILTGLSFLEIDFENWKYFKIFGIVLIFVLGIKEILTKKVEFEKTLEENPKSLLKAFFLGVILYTSNPTLMITMTALATFIKSLELFTSNLVNNIFLSFGLGIGSFLWFVFLVKFVKKYEEKITRDYYKYFVRISGGLMIGLSLLMSRSLLLAKG